MAYEKEIYSQNDYVRSFRPPPSMPEAEQSNAVFVGSGDSLAAAMLAESFSCCKARALDPLDSYQNRCLLEKKTAYFVSISGNTASNIRSARAAPKSVALTANPDSRLARSCDRTILLEYPNTGVLTAGSIGFLASALTCISLVGGFEMPRSPAVFDKAYETARKNMPRGRTFVLGNFGTYPLAVYCAAKMGEVLGIDARHCRMEQFSHMDLFSARKGDTVLIFDGTKFGDRLEGVLNDAGLAARRIGIRTTNRVAEVLFYAYFSQLATLLAARQSGQADCHFVLAERLRTASNKMIY